MDQQDKRFRVQFYTERSDGTPVYCVCDFGSEEETGLSPKVSLDGRVDFTTADHHDAKDVADALNSGELKLGDS